jgi:diguanylate cyclase (GGDEF)-like protein
LRSGSDEDEQDVMIDSTTRPTRFLSLRWKMTAMLSALLCAIAAVFVTITYWHLHEQFRQEQLARHTRYQQAFDAQVKQSAKRMWLFSDMLIVAAESGDSIADYLNNNWDLLQLDWGLYNARLYDASGNPLGNWGDIDKADASEWVAKVVNSNEPMSSMGCDKACRNYATLPIVLPNNDVNVLVLGASVADVVIAMQEVGNIDVALLVPAAMISGHDNASGNSVVKTPVADNHGDTAMLAHWNRHVAAITNGSQMLPLLEQASSAHSLDEQLRGYSEAASDGLHFTLHAYALPTGNTQATLIVIEDVSAEKNRIRTFLWQASVTLVVALAVLALTLTAMMMAPLKQVQSLSGMLPLLAQKAYVVVRENIRLQRHTRRHDELDILSDATIELSFELENLEHQVAEREQALQQMALYDTLTGLANRGYLEQQLETLFASNRLNQKPFALLSLDLDHFKRINDSIGHHMGDRLLIEAANRLRDGAGHGNTTARLGGDEFTVVVPEIGDSNALLAIAHHLLARLREPFIIDGAEILTSTSIGIAVAPENGSSPQELIRNADIAMYKAKDSGRNSVHFFTQRMNEEVQEQIQLEAELRIALKRRDFVLFYQPLIDLLSGRIVSAEALVRWIHPEKGLIPPMSFIPLLEDTGMITVLGDQVLDMATRQLREWALAGIDDIPVAINLSVRQLHDNHLLEKLQDAITRNQLKPSQLRLEITESLLMENTDRTINLLNAIKAMGVATAIDDFGTGYSSLSYLKRLPVDVIKIDRSFVKDIPGDKNDVEICGAVIAMAQKLELRVVAEGVETQAQADFLRLSHCDIAQGFLYSKPIPAAEFTALLMARRAAAS